MAGIDFPIDENVLAGAARADDAGVYRISDDLALVQTVDFFTPVVDDPFDFGRIAAANALSDVYAMGGMPKTALNIAAYPLKTLGKDVLRGILAGGAEKLREADTVLLGGHSIEDEELKYGLSVTGLIHPRRILANQGLKVGDCLILTKPLGTGILTTAIKGGLASEKTNREVTNQMVTLNRRAAEIMSDFSVSACTDITGFGLLGHVAEMVCNSSLSVTIESGKIPVLGDTYLFGSMGLVPVGAYNNKLFREHMVVKPDAIDPVTLDILYDPQTSGGLLIGCREEDAVALVCRLRSEGVESASLIGYVDNTPEPTIILR